MRLSRDATEGGGAQAVAVPSKLHPGSGGIHNAELLERFLERKR